MQKKKSNLNNHTKEKTAKHDNSGVQIMVSITTIYVAVLFTLYLLYIGNGGYQQITAQKWRMYFIVTGGYIFVLFLVRIELAIVGTMSFVQPCEVWRCFNLPQKLIVGYLIITLISTILSDYKSTAIWGSGRYEGFITIALYCASFLLISLYWQPNRTMYWLFAVAISLNCILCLIQFAGINPLHLYPLGMNYYDANLKYSGEFLGTIGNVDILSAVLSLSIPAFWAAILRVKSNKQRVFLLIPLALCLIVLLKSFVAGGVLGVAGAIVLSAPMMVESVAEKKRIAIGVVAILLVTLLSVFFFGENFGGFLYEASELLHGRWNDDFGTGRLYIWRNVIRLVPEHPLFGGGPDTLGLRTDAAFERYDEKLQMLIHSSIDNAHNEYLNILINQGLLALLFYLSALSVSAAKWIRDRSGEPMITICGCGILGYCIQAFFGISSPISTPYLWVALAIMNPCHTKSEACSEEKRRLR